MVGGEGWALGGEQGRRGEEVGKCKPNVGPGHRQEKQTLAGAWSGAPFKKGRKGWDRCLEKRKKEGGKKSRKETGTQSTAKKAGLFSGLVSLEGSVARVGSELCGMGTRARPS